MEESVKRVDSIEDMFDILDDVAAKRKRYTEIVTEYLKQNHEFHSIKYGMRTVTIMSIRS